MYCTTFHANGVVFRVKFSESTETYLKEIYRLSKTDEHVRSIDVASKLNVSKASVNGAVKKLAKEGYLNHRPYGLIFSH